MTKAKANPQPATDPSPEHYVDEVRAFMARHGQTLLLALLVVLAGLVTWNVLRIRNLRQSQAAGLAFLRAETSEELRAVAETFPGTAEGRYALIVLGNQLAEEEQYEEAARVFRQFLDAHSADPMAPVASLGLAMSQEAEGRFAQAETTFRDLARTGPDWLRGPAILGWGRSLEQLGRWDEARVVYEDGSARLPEMWAQSIQSSLQRVALEMRRPEAPPVPEAPEAPEVPEETEDPETADEPGDMPDEQADEAEAPPADDEA